MSIEHKYIYNGALLTLQELHSAGVLLGNAQPEEATVYSDDAGALGTRYTSESDGIIVKSEGDIYYYATQAECDAEWTTEEPVPEYFDTGWGEPVTIPTGYHVKAVKTSTGYAFKNTKFATTVGTTYIWDLCIGTRGMFGFDHGFTQEDINFGESGKPCLQMFKVNNYTESASTGYYMTYRPSQTPTTHGINFTGTITFDETYNLNSTTTFTNFFSGRKATLTWNSSSGTVASAMDSDTLPWQFRYYDADNVQVTYKFHLPTSLYTISGNVFTWVGNATQSSGLAFWYKRLGITAIRIWLEKD